MALTVDSKIRDLMANEQARAEVDRIAPGLTTHPQIGLVKGMSLRACASLLPDRLTPEVMKEISDMLERVTGKAESGAKAAEGASEKKKEVYNFDEIIDRENTNSVKYSTGCVLNPDLPQEHIPMWIADMDFACPQPVLDAMKARLDKKILGYSMPLVPEYYIAVIDWMQRRHGAQTNFDSIIYSSGVIPAMKVAVERLTKPGEGVIINTPAYHPFDDSVKRFNRTAVYSPLINKDGRYEFDFDDFEKKAKDPKNTLFFLCNPHNPSGRVWREDELRRVADICFANGVFIFCDEIHCDLVRSGQKHIPLSTLYPDETRYMTATAPSKTFNLAGNQLANILIPDKTLANEWRMEQYCGMPNPLSIDACIAAYTYCDGWLDALKIYLDDNFKYLDEALKKNLPKAKFRIPEGTYLAWIDMRALGIPDAELKKTVSRAGLFIEYSDEFVRDGDGFVRMNIACPRSVLKRAVKILCTALGDGYVEVEPDAPKRLEIGDVFPDISYDTPFETGKSLEKDLAGKPCVIEFLRYYGCTVCRLDIHELEKIYGFIKERGGELKVVLQSSRELVAKELEDHELPFEIICDPEGKLYRQFEINSAKNKLELAGSLAAIRKINAAKSAGFTHGEYEGDELRLPAVFVVGKDMRVGYTHYAKNLGDMPSAKNIAELIR